MGTPLYSHSRSEGRKESSLACCCCRLTFYYLWPGGIQPPFFPVVSSFSLLPWIRPDRIVHVGMPSSSFLGSAVSPSSVNRGRKGGRQGGTERGATTSDPIQSHVCQIFAMGRLPPPSLRPPSVLQGSKNLRSHKLREFIFLVLRRVRCIKNVLSTSLEYFRTLNKTSAAEYLWSPIDQNLSLSLRAP